MKETLALDPFQPNITCPSCRGGQEQIKTAYHSSEPVKWRFNPDLCRGMREEHLHYRCENCGYEWLTATGRVGKEVPT